MGTILTQENHKCPSIQAPIAAMHAQLARRRLPRSRDRYAFRTSPLGGGWSQRQSTSCTGIRLRWLRGIGPYDDASSSPCWCDRRRSPDTYTVVFQSHQERSADKPPCALSPHLAPHCSPWLFQDHGGRTRRGVMPLFSFLFRSRFSPK